MGKFGETDDGKWKNILNFVILSDSEVSTNLKRGFFVMWEMDYGMQNIDFGKFSLSLEFVMLAKTLSY